MESVYIVIGLDNMIYYFGMDAEIAGKAFAEVCKGQYGVGPFCLLVYERGIELNAFATGSYPPPDRAFGMGQVWEAADYCRERRNRKKENERDVAERM